LAFVDVTQCHSLINLDLSANNLLDSIDLSQNVALEYLRIKYLGLQNLDVTNCPNLKIMLVGQSNLTSLDLTQNLDLMTLNVSQNDLTSLDVTQNPDLVTLDISLNDFISFDVAQNLNLENLDCYLNELLSLDVSQNPNLVYLDCSSNPLTSLNIKNGHNSTLELLFALGCPDLYCIQVDDETAMNPICETGAPFSWCKDAIAEYRDQCLLGTESNTLLDISLYPNPAQDILYINSEEQIQKVSIYSTQGILVEEFQENEIIDLTRLSSGLYFIKASIKGDKVVKKFVKA
jgi:hypothetical protein